MKKLHPLAQIIFASRWLQVPLYVGLIFVQGLYAYRFVIEIYRLITTAPDLSETAVMMAVLGLIDIVLISNLLVMVIIGGYETFVSRLNLDGHPDEPEWLDRVSTGTLKIKLAQSLVSISSIHLLETFIDTEHQTDHAIMWQVVILGMFVISALVTAWIDRINHASYTPSRRRANPGAGDS
jgi:uncharacterized protein (TIGR00645 family)